LRTCTRMFTCCHLKIIFLLNFPPGLIQFCPMEQSRGYVNM
jgi:hypothetical protein